MCSHPVLVHNVGDNVQLAVVLAIVDDDNPSHLNVPLERHLGGLTPLPSDQKFQRGQAAYSHGFACEVNEIEIPCIAAALRKVRDGERISHSFAHTCFRL